MDERNLNEAISIFSSNYQTAEFMRSMRDLASLAGVLKELSTEKMYDSPINIIRFLNVIQLINEASLGIEGPIEGEGMLFSLYQSRFPHDDEPPEMVQIERILTILERNNWLIKQKHQIKLLDRGVRLLDGVIRMGNDALAYYSQDEVGRSLFQARRDADISVAYDDQGISGGHKIASIISHIEEATQQLEARQLELLADRNALPQLEKIDQLMRELEVKLHERLCQLGEGDEGTTLSHLKHRGLAAMSKGTTLSAGLLRKYTRFIDMQHTSMIEKISQEKVRSFIIQMYTQEQPNTPNAHDILSFMEQNLHEDEMLDGLWVPVKFAAPIAALDIKDAVDYLQHYEPKLTDKPPIQPEPIYEEVVLEERPIHEVLQDASWKVTQSLIDTEHVEAYLTTHEETELEQLMTETSSNKWHDAVLSLLAVSALTSNNKVIQKEVPATKTFDKQWEWINDDDKRFTVRKHVNDDE